MTDGAAPSLAPALSASASSFVVLFQLRMVMSR